MCVQLHCVTGVSPTRVSRLSFVCVHLCLKPKCCVCATPLCYWSVSIKCREIQCHVCACVSQDEVPCVQLHCVTGVSQHVTGVSQHVSPDYLLCV